MFYFKSKRISSCSTGILLSMTQLCFTLENSYSDLKLDHNPANSIVVYCESLDINVDLICIIFRQFSQEVTRSRVSQETPPRL